MTNVISSIAVLAVVLALVGLVIFAMIREKKRGTSSCRAGCAGCPMSEKCSGRSDTDKKANTER